jgi:hypothetical protein
MKRSQFSYTKFYCEENIYKFLEKLTIQQEIERRKCTSNDRSDGDAMLNSDSLLRFDVILAVVISSYNEPRMEHEKKNQWRSLVPIRVVEVPGRDSIVTWDYHVIAMLHCRLKHQWFVVDFDTEIQNLDADLLVPLDTYMRFSFQSVCMGSDRRLAMLVKQLGFRLVPAVQYLARLRSDRTHMLEINIANGAAEYVKPPPPYPPILSPSAILSSLQASESTTLPETPFSSTNNLVSFINMGNTRIGGIVSTYDNLGATLQRLTVLT